MERRENNIIQQKDESLIVQMLAKYITYWPLFLLFFALSVAASFTYLRYSVPKYQATASLIIKDEKKGSDDSKLMESLNMINTKKIIENEIEILQSRPLINEVVKKLRLYAPMYHEGKIKEHSAYMDAPVIVESLYPDSIKSIKEKIFLHFDTTTNTVSLNGQKVGNANRLLHTPFGVLRFVINEKYTVTQNAKPIYFMLNKVEDVTDDILKRLNVTATNKLSSVIELKYKDVKPNLAVDVLNQLLMAYNNTSINEKNSLAKNTLSLLEARLNVVAADLDSIEKKIQQYKASSGAVDISTQGQLFLQNVSTNDQKLSDINLQLSVINQLEKQVLNNEENISILPSSLGLVDGMLSQSLSNLNTAELEREKLKKTVAENNPLLVSVNDQIKKTKSNIIENIQSQRKTLEANRNNLNATNTSYNNMLYTIPQKERQLLEISRDQSIKNGIYSFLLQKREESELSYVSTLSDSRIVNYAQSSNIPVSPNKLLVMGIAFGAVLGIPVLLIGARETFSPFVLYRQEIETLTDIPIIGEVAFNKSKNNFVVEVGKRSAFAEEFRKIRFSLLAKGIDAKHKRILLTSSISGEGKSFIAANLAISFSLSGKKVVLLDIDLHNSSLGKIFGKQDLPGVSDFLTNDKNIEDLITPVRGYQNLFFVAAGSNKENASELLENGRLHELMKQLDDNYDLLIIDTAPIVLVTDAHILSSFSDATLYVVRHSTTPKVLLKRFDKNNELTPLNNLSIIFNGVKTRGYFNNNYGYGYGYVYGGKQLSVKETKRVNYSI
jgi:capsular exopolysaccharide synthesis family protein